MAVWVGYDNAGGKRRTLGSGGTGSGTAIPIFEPIIKASWEHVAPQAALAPPTPETKRLLIATSGGRRGYGDDREAARSAEDHSSNICGSISPERSCIRLSMSGRYGSDREEPNDPGARARYSYDGYGHSTWGFGRGDCGYGGFGGYGGRGYG